MPTGQLRLTLRRKPAGPKPVPRQERPAPHQSRQFARAMATQVARDRRLTARAASLAVLIVAICGRDGHVDCTRGYFASRMAVSERTVARLLAQLRSYGYIATVQTIGGFRETTGLRVQLLPALLPYWESPLEEGVTECSPLQESLHNQNQKGLPTRCSVVAYPRYRRGRRQPERTQRLDGQELFIPAGYA
jgi:hypothetical protein